MRVTREEYDRLIQIAEKVMKEAIFFFDGDEKWAGRKGMYFCLADGATGKPLFMPHLVGRVDAHDKAYRYIRLCKEKPIRLAEHPDHVSSFESRDPDLDMWGGAIRLDDLIFSPSGFPEHGDEAIALISAELWTGAYDIKLLETIANRSENPYWAKLRKYMARFS